MAFKHVFKIGAERHELTPGEALAVYAVAKLPPTADRNPRVSAIKFLRELKGGGLYEAKQIVDFLCDHGQMDRNGDLYMDEPKRVVTYAFEGC